MQQRLASVGVMVFVLAALVAGARLAALPSQPAPTLTPPPASPTPLFSASVNLPPTPKPYVDLAAYPPPAPIYPSPTPLKPAPIPSPVTFNTHTTVINQLLPVPMVITEITSQGGQIVFGVASEWTLHVPPGAVTQTTPLTIQAQLNAPRAAPEVGAQFLSEVLGIEAQALLTQPFTLTLNYGPRFSSWNVASQQLLALYYYNPQSTQWQHLPSRLASAQGMMTVTVNNGGLFALGVSSMTELGDYAWPWQPVVPAYSEDTFTGAVSWRVPLDAPTGRGSLQPNLALVYSSAQVDELHGHANPQTPGVGAGWRLNVPYIERVMAWDPNNLFGAPQVYANTTGQYRLVMDGLSEPLVCVTDTAPCTEFRTQAERFWRVERATDAPLPEGWEDVPLTREYWWVTTPDGTRYRFGYAREATPRGGFSAWFTYALVPDAPSASALWPVIWRWNLDLVADPHGNAVVYRYTAERREFRACVGAVCWATAGIRQAPENALRPGPYVRGGALAEVVWSTDAEALRAPYRLTVSVAEDPAFAPDLALFEPEDATSVAYASIAFYTRNVYKAFTLNMATREGWVPFRTYALTNSVDANGFLLLNAVQTLGMGGQALPATTFSYADNGGYRLGSCAGADAGHKPYLMEVGLTTGGRVKFNYTAPTFTAPEFLLQAGEICDAVADGEDKFWLRQRVRQAVTLPGVGQPPHINVYEYRAAQPAQISNGHWQQPHPQYPWAPAREFRGHPLVRVYQAVGSVFNGEGDPITAQLAGWQDTAFYQGVASDAPLITPLDCGGSLAADREGLQGRVYQQVSYSAAGQPLQSTLTRYGVQDHAQTPAHYAILVRASCHVWGTGSALARVEADYHSEYGYITEQREYASAAAAAPYRTTTTFNRVNVARWIVAKPELVEVWAGDNDAGHLVARTAYYYDRDAAGEVRPWASEPITGDVVRVDTPLLSGTVALQGAWQDTWYDRYGNVRQWRDARGYTTTLTYDPIFNQFPLRVCNFLGQCQATTYYGINGQSLNGGWLGQVARVWDANGPATATAYAYDGLGRLVSVVRPGDSAVAPTLRYTYFDAERPQRLETAQREQAGCVTCELLRWQFYDGLGRLVQRRMEHGGGILVNHQTYDALGRVQYVYVPRLETTTAYAAPALESPHTVIDYDALGRVLTQTAPDGTQTLLAYTGWQTAVLDANGHLRVSEADAWGRVVQVREYTQTLATPAFNLSPYATTRYAYDVLDRLTHSVDPLGYTTTITYDTLGRKVGLLDPDLGQWAYTYDLNGNLLTQTDNVGQVIWWRYDGLNRLVEKRARDANGPLLAQYTYDVGAFGVGRRVLVTAAAATNAWAYDARGRVVGTTQTITGVGSFAFSTAYDSADRVTTLTYPTGEVVTHLHDARGQLAGLRGLAPYASGLSYNALGQWQTLTQGNGAVTTWAYFDTPARGPLSYRLWEKRISGNGTDIAYWRYSYDNVGNMATLTEPTNAGQTQTFGYDAVGRLTSARTNGVGGGQYAETYAYNPSGDLLAKAGVTYRYTDPAHAHAVTGLSNGASYAYDANGNMTQRTEGGITYRQAYDIENRLISVSVSVGNANANANPTRFVYDGAGQRVLAIAPNGDRTAYIGNLLEVFLPALPHDPPPVRPYSLYLPLLLRGTGYPTGRATLKTYYYAGPQLIALRTANEASSTVHYLHTDPLGSVAVATDESGTVLARQRYLPFGGLREVTGPLPTALNFMGQRLEATGLLYYNARYYSPLLGRFVSAERFAPEVGNLQAFNRYVYTHNNPIAIPILLEWLSLQN